MRWDYGFTARLIAFAATKALHARKLREALATADSAGLQAGVEALRADAEDARALRDEFEVVWLRHARRSEIHLTLEQFDVLQRDYDYTINWLTRQPVADLSTFAPAPYARLWEKGQSELHNLASLAGPENLPEPVRSWLNPAPA